MDAKEIQNIKAVIEDLRYIAHNLVEGAARDAIMRNVERLRTTAHLPRW